MIGNQTSKILDPLIVVAGPTASGKSTMAVNLAEELNGEVVNIDSVQLYEGLNIGSGKISDKDKKGIKHHLLDIRKPSEPMDVADFISEAEKAISQVRSSNKTPVLVAGTTLYFKCLLHGLVDIPKADPKLRDELNVLTLEELVSRLERLDPTSLKKIAPTDKVRMIRAIEVAELAGRPMSETLLEHAHAEERYKGIILMLCWPREELFARIDARCKSMMQEGLIDETKDIIAKYGEVPALKSLGYAQAVAAINNATSKEDTLIQVQTKTRQFAKRQLTFWRNQPKVLGWKVRPEEGKGELLASSTTVARASKTIKDFRVLSLSLDALVKEIQDKQKVGIERSEIWCLDARKLF